MPPQSDSSRPKPRDYIHPWPNGTVRDVSHDSAEERARSRAAVVMARVSHQMANARKDSTVSQVGLAKQADVSPETISRLENGDGWADTYSIIRLGLELGVDFEVVDAETRKPIGRIGDPKPE